MIKILKLDEKSLLLERKTLLAAIEEDIDKGLITPENVLEEIRRLRTATDGRRIGFSHVAARYLEIEFSPVQRLRSR